MKKPNKFILTAAGFSIPFMEFEGKALSTNFLTQLICDKELMTDFVKKLYPPNLHDDFMKVQEITEELNKMLIQDYEKGLIKNYPNFEHIIYLLEILSNFLDKTTFSKSYNSFNESKEVPDLEIVNKIILQGLGINNEADNYELAGSYKFRRKTILRNILDVSNEIKDFQIKYKHVYYLKEFILDVVNLFKVKEIHKELLETYFIKILKGYNTKYYTLNYDSLIIEVLESLSQKKIIDFCNDFHTGSQVSTTGEINSAGIFKNLFKDRYKHSLFYLHGSIFYSRILEGFNVNFDTNRNTSHPLVSYQSLLMDQQNYSLINNDGGFRFNTSMITGMNKESKLSQEPYSSIFNKCRLDFIQAESIDIFGYSFGDGHVNSILKSLTNNHKEMNIIDYIESDRNEEPPKSKSFRNEIIQLFKSSCLHKATLEKEMFDKNEKFIKDNCWNYRFDETKTKLYLNGTIEYIREYVR